MTSRRQNDRVDRLRSGLPWSWQPTLDQREKVPADIESSATGQHWVRSVDVDAPPDRVFAWVTQLRRAPYSYDWVDNFGRRSPQELDRTSATVEAGDSVMTIFTATAVEPGRSMTVEMNTGAPTRLFGRIIVRYEAEPRAGATRLVVDMIVPRPPGPLAGLRRFALAWGDLLMMRKQLTELKRLAERDHRSGSPLNR